MLKFLALNDFFSPLYEKKPILQGEFEDFKRTFATYKANLNAEQNEDALVANALAPFLQGLQFKTSIKAKQEGKSEVDLILLKNGEISVLVEAKKPENSKEFFSPQNVNCKALAECILYYLRQRNADGGGGGFNYENLGSKSPNSSIKFIIITNFYDFYIFKAREFERLFATNKHFITLYANFTNPNSLFKGNTDEFYKETSKLLNSPEYLKSISQDSHEKPSLKGFHLNLKPILAQDKADFKSLKPVFKAFHKDFLLDEFNPNDANSLNSAFYEELLYILGLCEVKESSKLLIKPSSQSANTLYNAILAKLPQDKQDFERVMSFVVLWLNRILFLKLIEANLVRFNDDESLKFLNPNKVRNFKALSQLFFEILAKKPKDRANSTLDYLPYLNSALFQKQAIEREILDISALDDSATLPYFAKTQIKDKNAKKKAGSVPLLVYIFEFLDAFDFGSDEKSPELALQKELISSSVLGLVFEKLNGYKEGSFYTPSFITSYMCRASLEKVVLSKFNDKFKWQCEDLKALRERIDRDFSTKAQEFKAVLNSIRICDPAVGSGHFLVSALNEMIAIYHALGLAQRLNPCELALLSDELVITKPNGEIYAYKKPKIKNDESHAIQKALFTLKKQIIENNLFGVDINENSCEITKLRLWIELLKNSYYLQKDDEGFDENLNDEIHQMQTLPNIDINIKCGNSLISYFELNRSLTHYPNIKERMQKYKSVIKDYKEGFFDDKMRIEKEIKALKESFRTFCFKDKFNKEIKAFTAKCEAYSKKYGNFLAKDDENLSLYIAQSFSFFDFDESKARLEFNALKKEYESIFNLESKKPFEWRFEFPEVLNENGEFMGFDLVVGNPPYIRQEEIKELKPSLAKAYEIHSGTSDIYTYFFELGFKVLEKGGILSFITSNKFARAGYGANLREFLLNKTTLLEFVDLNGLKVFENAVVDTSIVSFIKDKASKTHKLNYANPSEKDLSTLTYTQIPQSKLSKEAFIFGDDALFELKSKIESVGTPLKEWDIAINYGIKTGYNEAFIIDTQTKEAILRACEDESERERTAKLIKPILRGRDIKRYSYEWANLWLIGTFPALKLNIDDYPALKKYLENFMPRIAQSGEKGCRKKTSNKWFETQDNIAYYEDFEKEKIVYPNMNKEFIASYDTQRFYTNQKCFIITSKNENLTYLTTLLNSKLNFWYFKQIGATLGANGYEMSKIFVEKLPIPKITNENENLADELVNLVNQILALKAENSSADTSQLEKDIDNLIYKLYNLTPKEIKIIQGA